MVVVTRIFLVIEVVKKTDDTPKRFVTAQFSSVRTHARLDRQGVLSQTF
jgi:hypothetical protein